MKSGAQSSPHVGLHWVLNTWGPIAPVPPTDAVLVVIARRAHKTLRYELVPAENAPDNTLDDDVTIGTLNQRGTFAMTTIMSLRQGFGPPRPERAS